MIDNPPSIRTISWPLLLSRNPHVPRWLAGDWAAHGRQCRRKGGSFLLLPKADMAAVNHCNAKPDPRKSHVRKHIGIVSPPLPLFIPNRLSGRP